MTYYYNAHGIGIDTKDPAFDSFIGEVPGDKSLPAVYLFSQARNGDGTAVAMCEDGTVIATHWCSHWGYMLHDLHDIRRDRYEDIGSSKDLTKDTASTVIDALEALEATDDPQAAIDALAGAA